MFEKKINVYEIGGQVGDFVGETSFGVKKEMRNAEMQMLTERKVDTQGGVVDTVMNVLFYMTGVTTYDGDLADIKEGSKVEYTNPLGDTERTVVKKIIPNELSGTLFSVEFELGGVVDV